MTEKAEQKKLSKYNRRNSIIENDCIFAGDYGFVELDSRKNISAGLKGLQNKCDHYKKEVEKMLLDENVDIHAVHCKQKTITKMEEILAKYSGR